MEKDLCAIEDAIKRAQTKLIEAVSGKENGGVQKQVSHNQIPLTMIEGK
jgi:hypothetical protein